MPDRPLHLDADPTRLEQVFGNLLNNASKFTPEGGHLWVTADAERGRRGHRSRAVGVRVRDDGIGIAPDVLPRVFDLFMQADRSLERTQGGLGIGLTLVRRFVELHGGRVEVRSAGLGMGASFVVCLPAGPRRPVLQAAAVAAAPHAEREHRCAACWSSMTASTPPTPWLGCCARRARRAHRGGWAERPRRRRGVPCPTLSCWISACRA